MDIHETFIGHFVGVWGILFIHCPVLRSDGS